MPLPVQSIRAKPEHRVLLQGIAEMLRNGRDEQIRDLLKAANAAPVGPFRNETAAIAFLRDRLVADLKPLSVWLFGSRAHGTAGAESDFDILVVLPDGLPAAKYSHEAVAKPVVACGLSYDIVPATWSAFEREKNDRTSFVSRIVLEGRELYRSRAIKSSTSE